MEKQLFYILNIHFKDRPIFEAFIKEAEFDKLATELPILSKNKDPKDVLQVQHTRGKSTFIYSDIVRVQIPPIPCYL